MRLAIVADTHSRPHESACELIAQENPDVILHAGDIGDLTVLDDLAELAPLIAVRGNIDQVGPQPDSVDISVMSGDRVRLRILLMHIALYGPRIRADAARLAKQHKATTIVCGHSHIPFIGRDRGLDVFNPGSIGPRRFSLPIVFGMLQLSKGAGRFEHVSCETRTRWSP